jgi:hypothetical protein
MFRRVTSIITVDNVKLLNMCWTLGILTEMYVTFCYIRYFNLNIITKHVLSNVKLIVMLKQFISLNVYESCIFIKCVERFLKITVNSCR